MKNTLTIIKKEFARFFKDSRLVITTLLLPGLMIYGLYSIMGIALESQFSSDETYEPQVFVVNMPDSINLLLEASEIPIRINPLNTHQIDEVKEFIENKETDLLMVFPEDFDSLVAAYDATSGDPAPHISMYYNSTATESTRIYSTMVSLLNIYESSMINKFDINFQDEIYDLASERDVSATIFATILPFLILVFLFSGCMAIAPESIAGEKERGTIATLLVTPIKRRELALGKMISLSVISLLAAISSFLGTILSLPKLMGPASDQMGTNVYGALEYFLIFLTIMSTVLIIIGIIATLSAFAKSVKEAATFIMPLMIVVMLVGITSMFGASGDISLFWFIVPIRNSVLVMTNIFSFNFTVMQVILTMISNIVFAGILTYILTKQFNNEKIMFSR